MKAQYVSGLKEGQVVSSPFLVRQKEIRTSPRTGKSWLELDLGDNTGSIPAKMWDNFEGIAKTFERDDVVQIRGRVKIYNGEREVTLEQVIPAAERDYDLADFLPHTKHDVEKLYQELTATIALMKNPWLKRLLESLTADPAIAPRLKRAPAAVTMHHAYMGGLLEHMVSLLGLARTVQAHYPELDLDLLIAGVVLHDIGKIEELRYERGLEYTTEGRLLGHIAIGARMAQEKIRAIPDFPAPLAVAVEHLILSHHGSYEFGSPTLPQMREAVALHFLDDFDSKMGSMRVSLEGEGDATGEEVWTGRNPSLRRSLLKADRFLSGEEGKPKASKANPGGGGSGGGNANVNARKTSASKS
jgi:3'-5' exoribonuclease